MCFLHDRDKPTTGAAAPMRGRRANTDASEYAARLGATVAEVRRVGRTTLEACKDDDARRVLLHGTLRRRWVEHDDDKTL
jgi:hypothetical protein